MAFSWEGGRSIADLFDTGPLDRAARRIADRVQEYILERVIEYTPVGEPPGGIDESDWIEERGGRKPGTLKDSWEKGEVEILSAGRIRVTILTHDPVAPHVEYPTRPHVIRPKTPRIVDEDGVVHGGILRFRDSRTGQVIWATEVHHPGTEGSYMLARALQDAARVWPTIVRDELIRWEREQVRMSA